MLQTLKKVFSSETSPSVGQLGTLRIDANRKDKTLAVTCVRSEAVKEKVKGGEDITKEIKHLVYEATLKVEDKAVIVLECAPIERKITPKEIEAIRKWLVEPSESYKGLTNIQRVNQIFG